MEKKTPGVTLPGTRKIAGSIPGLVSAASGLIPLFMLPLLPGSMAEQTALTYHFGLAGLMQVAFARLWRTGYRIYSSLSAYKCRIAATRRLNAA